MSDVEDPGKNVTIQTRELVFLLPATKQRGVQLIQVNK